MAVKSIVSPAQYAGSLGLFVASEGGVLVSDRIVAAKATTAAIGAGATTDVTAKAALPVLSATDAILIELITAMGVNPDAALLQTIANANMSVSQVSNDAVLLPLNSLFSGSSVRPPGQPVLIVPPPAFRFRDVSNSLVPGADGSQLELALTISFTNGAGIAHNMTAQFVALIRVISGVA